MISTMTENFKEIWKFIIGDLHRVGTWEKHPDVRQASQELAKGEGDSRRLQTRVTACAKH